MPVSIAQRCDALTEQKSKLPVTIGRLLCLVGFHDFRVIDVTFGFGAGDSVEKVECKRCGIQMTRQSE